MANKKKELFSRFGIASKGLVYVLTGLLITLTALNMGGEKTGKSGALAYLSDQLFGKILLVVIIVGLMGYVFLRLYQALADLEDHGTDIKGIANRIDYAGRGLLYGIFALTGVKLLFNLSSGSSDQKQQIMDSLLKSTTGQVAIVIIGCILLGRAIYQLYYAYSGKYKKKIQKSKLGKRSSSVLFKMGIIGYTARALVIGSIAFLTFRSIYTKQGSTAGGTEDAVTLLQNSFGEVVLLGISVGLILYGLFTILKAKYRRNFF